MCLTTSVYAYKQKREMNLQYLNLKYKKPTQMYLPLLYYLQYFCSREKKCGNKLQVGLHDA